VPGTVSRTLRVVVGSVTSVLAHLPDICLCPDSGGIQTFLNCRSGSTASPSSIEGYRSVSAVPRWRPRSSGGAICRDRPTADIAHSISSSAAMRPGCGQLPAFAADLPPLPGGRLPSSNPVLSYTNTQRIRFAPQFALASRFRELRIPKLYDFLARLQLGLGPPI